MGRSKEKDSKEVRELPRWLEVVIQSMIPMSTFIGLLDAVYSQYISTHDFVFTCKHDASFFLVAIQAEKLKPRTS